MKKLINLWCRKAEIEIENKIMYRKEIKEIHKLLKQGFEIMAELKFVVDYTKNSNYKDIYVMEHNKCLEQEKEIKKLRKENKQLLKEAQHE